MKGTEQHDGPKPSITRYFTIQPIPSGWVIMSVMPSNLSRLRAVIGSMNPPAIIIGEPNSVLRLPKSGINNPDDWTQLDSDLLAHFVQVHQQIARSSWYNAEMSMSGEGACAADCVLPGFEDFVFAAVYFRQLTMKKDDLFNDAVNRFCRFIDCPVRSAWIKEEQKAFNAELDSESFFLPGYTIRDLFDAFMYGAGLMHKSQAPGSKHRTRFLQLYDNEPRAKVLFALNGGMRTLLNPVANVVVVVHREFSHWLADYSLPLPDVRWHDRLFEINTRA